MKRQNRFYQGSSHRIIGKSKTAHRTTILINKEDWEFLKTTKLKPTNLLRSKIDELRNKGFSTDWEKAATRMREKLEKVCGSMAETLTPEQYNKIMSS